MPKKTGYKRPTARSSKAVKRIDDHATAFALRRRGLTYEEIGEQLGVDRATVRHWVTKRLTQLAAETLEDAPYVRDMELQRLDRWLAMLHRQIERGNSQAVQSALKISARRSALLGLDAPVKAQIVPPPPQLDIDVTKLSAEQLTQLEQLLAIAGKTSEPEAAPA